METGRDTVADVNFIQTRQIAFSHNLVFPGLLPHFHSLPAEIKENARTILAFNVANTERRELFNLSSYSAAWGYDFRYHNHQLKSDQGVCYFFSYEYGCAELGGGKILVAVPVVVASRRPIGAMAHWFHEARVDGCYCIVLRLDMRND